MMVASQAHIWGRRENPQGGLCGTTEPRCVSSGAGSRLARLGQGSSQSCRRNPDSPAGESVSMGMEIEAAAAWTV